MTHDVTIAICTWNRAESLRQTLETFLGLQVPSHIRWELVVVNNACSDHTDDVVRSFDTRLPIRLLHESRPGQSYARNLAIAEARGRIIAWTDDDVLVDPQWVAGLLEGFATFDADWVFGRSFPRWPGKPPGWYSKRFSGLFAELDYGSSPYVVTDKHQCFYGLNHAGTREAHQRIGGYRTEFGLKKEGGGVGEDTDMFDRALAAHMKIVYTPDAVVHHVIPEARTRKRYHLHRMWVSNAVVFTYLPEFFPDAPRLLGLPRFFFAKALEDGAGYVGAVVRGRWSDAFQHQLHLVRFARLFVEAARHGFKTPRPTSLATSVPRQ